MTRADRNAAIWYVDDGYDPEKRGINGRRVAGASFLKGFLRHADVSEYVSVTKGDKGRGSFADQIATHASGTLPHRNIFEGQMNKLGPVGTLYYPAPNYAEHLWRRQPFGMNSYSICGITHTTATQAVMRGFHDLRAGPQTEWDAVICTSRAVHAATLRNIEIADDFLRARFGQVPPRPQMPIIPLGINCDDYAHDEAAAAAFRKRLRLKSADVAVVTISRLIPYGKFDPGPLFVALQTAQEQLGKRKKLHFVACGVYADKHSENVFNTCARELMPDVGFHHLPGDDSEARRQTLSGGDIFAFPIDNIQETFGLSPIEAMAAGLPLVVSDWDGMRDTVSPDAGFRIPTRLVSAEGSNPEARGYLSGAFSYPQYGNRMSMLTELGMAEMTEAFATLARDKALRTRMGKAGLKRATMEYDWSRIIPRMQDFWAELATIRAHYANNPLSENRFNPMAPRPGDLFASYAKGRLNRDTDKVAFTATPERLLKVFSARRYGKLGHPAERHVTLNKACAALLEHGEDGCSVANLARDMKWNAGTVERCLLFFLKFGLARVVGNR